MPLFAHNRYGVLRGCAHKGDCKERVTLCSGFSGVKRPEWDGATPSPSGEPTTTKAERVVIVGYIKGKPLSVRYSLRLPLSSIKEGFHRHCRLGMY
ncbi:MAG: hypothetical protein Q3Y16_08615 [Bacteroides sp.]|uniref:hypothetical protein n=1 Tax=unclassified Bacteroides TaxID=2646097 RepID=UPI001401F1FE|nr:MULTISPECIES: hypothetical protein [unclassified Bacteroides]MDR3821322.1 hypothetical protein [Bacteroides sp.]